MSKIFSPAFKYTTWRRLWVALAKGEKEIGLSITESQIKAMEEQIDHIDFSAVMSYEKETRHDVMAHVLAYGDSCPEAKGIIHLGATSAYVTDNTDLIQMREGLKLLKGKLLELLRLLSKRAEQTADLPTLSYTHLQPAQPTTVGKRICTWLQDFLFDFSDLINREESLLFLGLKGATGTQASFMALLSNDEEKVEELDRLIAKEMGFENLLTISGQTYTRKQDMRIISVLEGLAATSHKCATDLRLLAHMGEIEEGRGEKQIGSSAMPHKTNPILAERTCALARFLLSLGENPKYTLATQWLERSLDDSANRRLAIPEAFLTADALLNLLFTLFTDLNIYPNVIAANLSRELPFLSLENILMGAVSKGKDRQEVHEHLRKAARKASLARKEGKEEDLISAIAGDENVGLSRTEIDALIEPAKLTGRASLQVSHFLEKELSPLLDEHRDISTPITPISL
ncbi:MAG: Adenylosuccinate lyase [Chlamydiae bacterium]|nr:Adenylosuccinate lyase [Chlamydiota bacterium]